MRIAVSLCKTRNSKRSCRPWKSVLIKLEVRFFFLLRRIFFIDTYTRSQLRKQHRLLSTLVVLRNLSGVEAAQLQLQHLSQPQSPVEETHPVLWDDYRMKNRGEQQVLSLNFHRYLMDFPSILMYLIAHRSGGELSRIYPIHYSIQRQYSKARLMVLQLAMKSLSFSIFISSHIVSIPAYIPILYFTHTNNRIAWIKLG